MQNSPYQRKSNSSPVERLSISSFTASDGKSYSANGYIEMFQPNYFVIVGAPDARSLQNDIKGASLAASEVVKRFDCQKGTEVRQGSHYSQSANKWLIVIDCATGGRKLTGT